MWIGSSKTISPAIEAWEGAGTDFGHGDPASNRVRARAMRRGPL